MNSKSLSRWRAFFLFKKEGLVDEDGKFKYNKLSFKIKSIGEEL